MFHLQRIMFRLQRIMVYLQRIVLYTAPHHDRSGPIRGDAVRRA